MRITQTIGASDPDTAPFILHHFADAVTWVPSFVWQPDRNGIRIFIEEGEF